MVCKLSGLFLDEAISTFESNYQESKTDKSEQPG